jgi:predicted RNA-binding protein with PIN domain
MRWLVDASNVIGSRPDGWWRDREGAARRLIAQLSDFAEACGDRVTVVLDPGPAELAGRSGGVEVVVARRRGRNAADDEIVRLLAEEGDPADVRVATSDAELAARVRGLGAGVEGAKAFRERLERS